MCNTNQFLSLAFKYSLVGGKGALTKDLRAKPRFFILFFGTLFGPLFHFWERDFFWQFEVAFFFFFFFSGVGQGGGGTPRWFLKTGVFPQKSFFLLGGIFFPFIEQFKWINKSLIFSFFSIFLLIFMGDEFLFLKQGRGG